MTDEEKKAIIELNHYINMTAYWKQQEYTNSEIDNYIEIVLNLIIKQQKEIEEQNSQIDEHVFWESTPVEQIKNNYIPKSKIEENLEIAISIRDGYLEKCKEHILIPIYNERIKVLKELLESEE